MGRPSDFTQETADTICTLLGEGKSLRTICDADEMPSQSSVFRWLQANEPFREQYARARDTQAETVFDRMRDVAADEVIDVNRARLMIETDKWYLGKLKPKAYGDKVEQVHTGGIEVKLIERRIIDTQS